MVGASELQFSITEFRVQQGLVRGVFQRLPQKSDTFLTLSQLGAVYPAEGDVGQDILLVQFDRLPHLTHGLFVGARLGVGHAKIVAGRCVIGH